MAHAHHVLPPQRRPQHQQLASRMGCFRVYSFDFARLHLHHFTNVHCMLRKSVLVNHLSVHIHQLTNLLNLTGCKHDRHCLLVHSRSLEVVCTQYIADLHAIARSATKFHFPLRAQRNQLRNMHAMRRGHVQALWRGLVYQLPCRFAIFRGQRHRICMPV